MLILCKNMLLNNFKFTSQTEQTDCGPTCLKMMCDYYQKDISLRYIKESMTMSRIGVTMRDVANTAKQLGYEYVIINSDISKLKRIQQPMILYWTIGHYVVCYQIKKKKGKYVFFIADPACGKVSMSEEDLIEAWIGKDGKGCGILLSPSESFEKKRNSADKKGTNIIKDLLQKYSIYSKFIFLSLFLMFVAIGCNWIIPILYEKIINNAVVEGNLNLMWQLFLIQLSFFLGYLLSNSISSILIGKMNFQISLNYLSGLLRKIIWLPQKYFDTKLNTEFLQRMDDYYKLQDFLTGHAITTLFAIINIIVFSSLLAWYTWIGLLIFVLFSILSAILTINFLPKYKYVNYSLFTSKSRNRNILYEIINGMSDIKSNNAEEKHIEKWTENQHKINKLSLTNLLLDQKQNIINTSINRLRDICVISLCAYLVIKGELTLGALMSVSYILGQLSIPISQIQNIPKLLQDAGIVVDRLSEIQLRKTEKDCQRDNKIANVDTIKLKDVSFKYEGSFNPYIFENLTINFPKGKMTAIVGNSGSGKSTLIKLLLGFYMPQKGNIDVGEIPMSDINLDFWRANCGTVLQDGRIFSMTVAENIALGDRNVDKDRLEECARLACINDYIEKMPSKYDTKIGGSGLDLSQGQKQRILIARALYKNPELLILDEATSSLDTVNERRIMDNLDDYFKDRTVIVVAHRLSTVVRADNIIFLENGKIAEQGTHKELVAKRGKYYELIKNQLELEK